MPENIERLLNQLCEIAKTKKMCVTLRVEPNMTEVSMEPWQPYETTCPYGKEKDHDRE